MTLLTHADAMIDHLAHNLVAARYAGQHVEG